MFRMRSVILAGTVCCTLIGARPFSDRLRVATTNNVAFNDNLAPAGAMTNGVLELKLETREGAWKPYGASGPVIPVFAFGEAGKSLQMPGPMIRVKAGARIHVSVHNAAKKALVMHGLADRRTPEMDTLTVQPGETRDVRFTASDVGTFFYWGTTTGAAFADRYFEDSQLNGAIIVDPAVGTPKPDRVFVVQLFVPQKNKDGTPNFNNAFLTFNGRPWPQTERLQYAQGDSVHWRVINASADVHPLHLHGFYFRVTARGDNQRDTTYWKAQERMAVTELMDEQQTMDIAWFADRPGGWIFHCHLNFHVLPNPPLGDKMLSDSARTAQIYGAPAMDDMAHMSNVQNHAEMGMGGLLLAIDVKPKGEWHAFNGARERFHLFIETDSQPKDSVRHFGYVLSADNDKNEDHKIRWPGPPIVLHRGRPTSIMVVNRATEPSQVHWHGLEIDSYYDGVAGLSKSGGKVSPMIMPRDSFEVTVTPPRAGSFMYHTHINDLRQQSGGLYGPIIVLDSGATWDRAHDHIFQIGSDTSGIPILNGSRTPPELTLYADERYRLRLMNISLDVPFNEFTLKDATGVNVRWTPIAKDGFDLPSWQRTATRKPASVSIGETRDVTVSFATPGEYTMAGQFPNGTVFAKQLIHVLKAK